ncbi:hypothetical protein CGT92_17945 [Vibrio metoecus]|nr:hypothetical protein CGT92_17945 [Vibrio metoecus]PAR59371.1 hypothetical protein CGT91_18720 [Vibrio metoecus]
MLTKFMNDNIGHIINKLINIKAKLDDYTITFKTSWFTESIKALNNFKAITNISNSSKFFV